MASIQKRTRYSKRAGRNVTRYRVHYRKDGAQAVSPFFDTKADARHFLENLGDVRSRPDRRAGRVPVRAVWEEVHPGTYAPATLALHDAVWRHVGDALGPRPVGDVTPAEVDRVLARIDGPAMRDKARLVLSAVFARAVDEGRIAENPARSRRRSSTRADRIGNGSGNGRHRELDAGDLRRLLAEVPDRYRALVQTMAVVGLRPGEAYALTVGQLGTALSVDRATAADGSVGPTKTGEARTVPLPADVVRLLDDHVARYSDPTDPDALVFTTGDGTPVRHSSFRQLLGRASRRAGVDPVVPNDLRHTAAAHAIDRGVDVYGVQRMLGHAKPSITLDTYGYRFDRTGERTAAALEGSVEEVFGPR